MKKNERRGRKMGMLAHNGDAVDFARSNLDAGTQKVKLAPDGDAVLIADEYFIPINIRRGDAVVLDSD